MRSLITAAALPLVLLGVSTHVPGGAATAEQARSCTIVLPDLAVSPGLGLQASSGAVHSARKGTVDCDGEKGTAVLDGRYGTSKAADCASGGDGWGVMRIKLGKEEFGDTFIYTFGANTKSADLGEIHGERLDGTYMFLGTTGNCVTAPITVGTARMTVKIRPA